MKSFEFEGKIYEYKLIRKDTDFGYTTKMVVYHEGKEAWRLFVEDEVDPETMIRWFKEEKKGGD